MARTVELENTAGGRKSFRFDHAVNILEYERKMKIKCWTLPADSLYKLENGALIFTGGNQEDQGTQERPGDTGGQGETLPASATHGVPNEQHRAESRVRTVSKLGK